MELNLRFSRCKYPKLRKHPIVRFKPLPISSEAEAVPIRGQDNRFLFPESVVPKFSFFAKKVSYIA